MTTGALEVRRVVPTDDAGNELSPSRAMTGFQSSAADGGNMVNHVGAVGAVAREEAEIKAAIVLARSAPRDEMAAYQRILKACKRPSFAEGTTYSYPRGGSRVVGPSVYLAREMARCWGNVRSGIRVVSMDAEYVQVKGYCYDLETNSYKECESKFRALVQRKVNAPDGSRTTQWVKPDERDLRELINKHGAICERNAILQSLPPDFTEDAVSAAAATLSQAADGDLRDNPAETIKRLVLAFGELSVTPDMIAAKLGHKVDQLSPSELAELRQVYTSIRDGNSRREEHFEVGQPASAPSSGADKTKAAADKLNLTKKAGKRDDEKGVTTAKPEPQY